MIRTSMTVAALALAVAAGACGTDLGSGPATSFGGVKYTAATNAIVSQNGSRQFSVVVTLENTTAASQTRTYPLSCPVHVRLYRTGDNVLVYDEDKRPCSATPTGTITIDPRSTNTLQSGVRFPSTVAGDSLPLTTYNVKAVVYTEGANFLVIDAGTVSLGSGSLRASVRD